MRIVSIVGARPQFVKLAVMSRAVARRGWVHRIVHTGQHYDSAMSAVFFDELGIPEPDHHLGVGSGGHSEQTGEMLKRLDPVLSAEQPDWVLLYGDTNSTLAGAIVGAKLGLPLAHIEAGLRSHRRTMPEEINRVVTDHLSDLLLCPTPLAVSNLQKEGLGERAVLTGDIMYDAVLEYRRLAEERGAPQSESWPSGEFALATVHRAENTDDPEKLKSIAGALERISETICPVVWPVHPRTRKRLAEMDWRGSAVRMIEPASYMEMLLLEGRARFILTDSGGVQKEAYFLRVPCITLREETEWEETLENGCNLLAGSCAERIQTCAGKIANAGPWTAVYGDGKSAEAILTALESGPATASRLSDSRRS